MLENTVNTNNNEYEKEEVTMNNEIVINEMVISDILKNLGISPSLKGYHYVKYGIKLMAKNIKYLENICNNLYPEIAEQFNTTASRVERAIRHAVFSGWLKGDSELQTKLFSYTVSADKANPTNSEFMATVADYIKMI